MDRRIALERVAQQGDQIVDLVEYLNGQLHSDSPRFSSRRETTRTACRFPPIIRAAFAAARAERYEPLFDEIVEIDDLGGVGLRAVRDQHGVNALAERYAERAGDDLFALAIAQHEIVVADLQVQARRRARSREREVRP